MTRKKLVIILAIVAFLTVSWFAKVFPDPYHEEDNVNFWVWVWREMDELLHGEHPVEP